jgi:hypothetical protein
MTLRLARAAAVAFACIAAAPALAADAVFPTGSKIGLVPPTGFVPSENFRGFEDRANNAAILLVELPAQAYRDVEKAMTTDALKKQGVAIDKRENVALKDGKAILLVGKQTSDGTKLRKWILIGTTPQATVLITAIIPETVTNLYPDPAVRTSLVSLAVRAEVPLEEQLSLLPFKLENYATLRAFRVEPNTVFLTDGPKDGLDAPEQVLLVVSAAVGGPGENAQRDIFARNLFSGLPGYKDIQIVGSETIRSGGQQTHQLMAEAKDARTGSEVKLVQWLRFGNGAFIRFLGVAKADGWVDALSRFRTVRDNLAPR